MTSLSFTDSSVGGEVYLSRETFLYRLVSLPELLCHQLELISLTPTVVKLFAQYQKGLTLTV